MLKLEWLKLYLLNVFVTLSGIYFACLFDIFMSAIGTVFIFEASLYAVSQFNKNNIIDQLLYKKVRFATHFQ